MILDDRSDRPLNRFDEIADYRSKKRLLRYQERRAIKRRTDQTECFPFPLVTTSHREKEARANLSQRRIRASRSFRVTRRLLTRKDSTATITSNTCKFRTGEKDIRAVA